MYGNCNLLLLAPTRPSQRRGGPHRPNWAILLLLCKILILIITCTQIIIKTFFLLLFLLMFWGRDEGVVLRRLIIYSFIGPPFVSPGRSSHHIGPGRAGKAGAAAVRHNADGAG